MTTPTALVQKLWNYDGLSYGDYVEQLTFLLFLKMADEQSRPPFNKASAVPAQYAWPSLLARDGNELETHYLKDNPLQRSDLDDFLSGYHPANHYQRRESERFKPFSYVDLLKRDKVNLDIFWLKDEALEESANLPAPELIAREIADDLEAALEQFAAIADDLK